MSDGWDVSSAEREIQRALIAVCEGVDRLDASRIRLGYHVGSTHTNGSLVLSGPEFADFIVERLPGVGFVSTSHQLANIRIDVDGETASVNSYYTSKALRVDAAETWVVTVVGQYEDTFRLIDGRWAIWARVVHADFDHQEHRQPTTTPPAGAASASTRAG